MSLPNATGGLISSFSSYGLYPDLTLKPDIGAPGGYIRSTFPIELGSDANLSGTSMSSPHVAGSVALLLEARPHTPSQAVRDILQNNAAPAVFWAIRQRERACSGSTRLFSTRPHVSPGKLSLRDTQAGPVTQTLTISNEGMNTVTYDLSNAPALATGPNAFVPAFFVGNSSITFAQFGAAITNVTGAGRIVGDDNCYGRAEQRPHR